MHIMRRQAGGERRAKVSATACWSGPTRSGVATVSRHKTISCRRCMRDLFSRNRDEIEMLVRLKTVWRPRRPDQDRTFGTFLCWCAAKNLLVVVQLQVVGRSVQYSRGGAGSQWDRYRRGSSSDSEWAANSCVSSIKRRAHCNELHWFPSIVVGTDRPRHALRHNRHQHRSSSSSSSANSSVVMTRLRLLHVWSMRSQHHWSPQNNNNII